MLTHSKTFMSLSNITFKCTALSCQGRHVRGDVKIPTYKPHTNHKKPSVSSHTLAPTTICDLSHSICGSPLTDLGHISSVTYGCHPLWVVCGYRKGILTSPLIQKNYLLLQLWSRVILTQKYFSCISPQHGCLV